MSDEKGQLPTREERRQEHSDRFAQVPRRILYSTLSPGAIRLYAVLDDYRYRKTNAAAVLSLATLSNWLDANHSSVTRWAKELETMDVIEVVRSSGVRNAYRLTTRNMREVEEETTRNMREDCAENARGSAPNHAEIARTPNSREKYQEQQEETSEAAIEARSLELAQLETKRRIGAGQEIANPSGYAKRLAVGDDFREKARQQLEAGALEKAIGNCGLCDDNGLAGLLEDGTWIRWDSPGDVAQGRCPHPVKASA